MKKTCYECEKTITDEEDWDIIGEEDYCRECSDQWWEEYADASIAACFEDEEL